MFEDYGIRVSSEQDNLHILRLREFVTEHQFDLLNYVSISSAAFVEGFN